MKSLLLLMILASLLVQAPSPASNGVIEGKVARASSTEGVPDVQITMIGPSPVALASSLGTLYSTNASLTPAMREQIEQLINSAPPGITLEVVANAAMRMEAQLLGLTAPTPLATNTPGTQPPQTVVVTDREG